MSASDFIARLEKVKSTGTNRWVACCPAHKDRHPSLTITELADERVLVHCFAGCGIDEIMQAVGLEMDALFPPKPITDTVAKRPVKPFNAYDVLKCVAHEALIATMAASFVANGGKLSDEECLRLHTAAGRIAHALDVALS